MHRPHLLHFCKKCDIPSTLKLPIGQINEQYAQPTHLWILISIFCKVSQPKIKSGGSTEILVHFSFCLSQIESFLRYVWSRVYTLNLIMISKSRK